MDTILMDSDSNIFQINNGYSHLLETLSSTIIPTTPDLGLLPPVVRYISPWTESGEAIAIVEAIPHMRTIIFQDTAYIIPIPWVHSIFRFRQTSKPTPNPPILHSSDFIGLFFSKTKLEFLDHTFYEPYLLNILDPLIFKEACLGFHVCLPHDCVLDQKRHLLGSGSGSVSFTALYDVWMSSVFSTPFNTDAVSSFERFIGRGMSNPHPYNTPSFVKEALNDLSALSIADAINLLDQKNMGSVPFKEIYETFENDAKRFSISSFVQEIKALDLIEETRRAELLKKEAELMMSKTKAKIPLIIKPFYDEVI